MEIQTIQCNITQDQKLAMSWMTMVRVRAIQISVSNTSTFTKNTHNYLLPEQANMCVLDIGNGSWFLRIGAWVNSESTETTGSVKWSGIIGPIVIQNSNTTLSESVSAYSVPATNRIENGYRLITNKSNPNYIYIEVSKDTAFSCTETKYLFMYDWGAGKFDIPNLDALYTYSIRYTPFNGYPRNSMVKLPLGTVVLNCKPLSTQPTDVFKTNVAYVKKKEEQVFVQEMREKPIQKFGSHSDYLRFKTARLTH